MSDYLVYGKKGNGKSLVCVGRMVDALKAGKVVATNLDLQLEKLLPAGVRNVRCYRLPDRPTIDDLRMIGIGSESVDESTYGLVVLDECATMLNARSFNDKGRKEMLDWFVHSRKLGWDSYFICQNPVQIDKQVRESLIELSVSCKRLDKIRVPFIGSLSKHLFGTEIRAPKIHVATVRYGTGNEAMVSDRWTYRGLALYSGYNTRQVFREDYSDGVFSYLSPWHLRGRSPGEHVSSMDKIKIFLGLIPSALPMPNVLPAKPWVAKLKNLSPDERIAHWRRLNAAGAI